MLEKEVLELYT